MDELKFLEFVNGFRDLANKEQHDMRASGVKFGRRWADEDATLSELERLIPVLYFGEVERCDDTDCDDVLHPAKHLGVFMIDAETERSDFWTAIVDHSWWEDDFVLGFAEGALMVWGEARGLI